MPQPHHQSIAAARWTVRPVGDLSGVPESVRATSIPATVPGCIHTDLIDAGLIPDPAIGDAEERIQWVSMTDWRYECEFEAAAPLSEHDEIDLVLDCIDTVARIELNGRHIGDAASEFLPHRFPIRGLLTPGANTLAITFTSPIRHARAESARLGPRPVNGDWEPYNMIRKCSSNFQWDWGPKVATCGITADVRLDGWSAARIADVIPSVRQVGASEWIADVTVTFQTTTRCAGSRMLVTATLSSPMPPGEPLVRDFPTAQGGHQTCRIQLAVQDVKQWLPRGAGEPLTHTLDVRLHVFCGDCIETEIRGVPVAFRTIELEDPERFALRINGRRVHCRGANWIPEGLFPRDRTPDRVRQRLQQLVDANMNTLRIWGGGRYEPDWFYDLCDELGIMVWHDFMFACACYPEEEPIRSLVEAEARHHVARLARHPSVVLWCGGNENHWAYESWGFKDKLAPGQTWGKNYWNDLLPRIVAELSPGTPYRPDSPWSGDPALHPNDPPRGDHHTWEITLPADYRKLTPSFVTEFGWQSPSTLASLTEAAAATLPELARRQRGPGGMPRWYDDPLHALFPHLPADVPFETWLAHAHDMQARYLSTYIEWLRIHPETCRGILIWQLNDAWPGNSWSLIDSAGREKPAYHAVKRAFAPRLLTVQPVEGRWTLHAVNDTDEQWGGTATLRRVAADGSVVASAQTRFEAPPWTATPVTSITHLIGDPLEDRGERITAAES